MSYLGRNVAVVSGYFTQIRQGISPILKQVSSISSHFLFNIECCILIETMIFVAVIQNVLIDIDIY